MKYVCPIAALLALFSSLSAADAYDGPPGSTTFTGEGIVESINSVCATNSNAAVGEFFSTIYLYGGNSHNDSLYLDHNDFVLVYTPTSSSSLNGSNTVNALFINNHAEIDNRSGSTQFNIGSVGGLPTAQAINLKVVGTINDFIDPGCSIVFHAVLVTKPLTGK